VSTAAPALSGLQVHHVSIAVTDMARAIDWYGRIFGFTVMRQFHVPGIPADGAFLRGPGILLELWCAVGVQPVPESRRVPDSDLRTAGTKHLAFTVDNLQGQLAALLREGVEIAGVQRNRGDPMRPDPEPLAAGKAPAFAVFVRDPFGTLIEILERERAPA
jgi:catechol 2,3-dioxygenase-like lactoylglutathione lyase family enzyme